MTEVEWQTGTDPGLMFAEMRGQLTERKLRLFACYWAYELWDRMTDDRSRAAITIAELYADGHASWTELADAFQAANSGWSEITWAPAYRHSKSARKQEARRSDKQAAAVARQAANPMLMVEWGHRVSWRSNAAIQHLLATHFRDIVGNPFRPVEVEPHWVTATVLTLAAAIYESRTFDRLPILADALEEAGCDNADVLAHCRGDGPHARGCWVVDLVLGKG